MYSGNSDPAVSTFDATRLILSNVAGACDGLRYTVIVADNSGSALETLNGTITLAGNSQTFVLPAVDSRDIYQYVVTIYE